VFFELEAFQPRPLMNISRPQGCCEPANLVGQLRLIEQGGRVRPVFPVQPLFVNTVSFAVRL
jgi:hypothetical protein